MRERSNVTEAVNPRYETLRDNLPGGEGAVGTLWRDADRFADYLRETYRNLEGDESLSDEGKAEKAQEAYQRTQGRIANSLKRAREKAASEVKAAREESIPMPNGKTLASSSIKDTSELLAVQQETNTILSRVESRRAKLPEGMSVRTDIATDVLRDSYRQAMERGSVEGAAQARATLRAGEELGVSADEIVGPYREERHYEAAEHARRMELVAATIPSERSIPKPLFSKPAGSPQGVGTYGAGAKLSVPRKHGQMFKRTRPLWK
jgi:hypothetical protein